MNKITNNEYSTNIRTTNTYKYVDMKSVRNKNLVYPELSYQIIGSLFEVYNTLGAGYQEKYYQKAIANEFTARDMHFVEQVPYKLFYKNKDIGSAFLDFLVEDNIILEIKRGNYFSKKHIDQVLGYLKITGKKLAILANFSSHGVTFKRIVNMQ